MARCKIKALVFKDMDSYIKNFCKLVLLAPPGSFMDSEWVNRFCEKLPSRYHDLIHDIQQKNIIDNFEEVVQEACNFKNGNMAVQSQFADCTTKDSSGRQSTCFDAWKKRTKHASMHTLHMVSMVDHLPKINIHLPDGLRVFMLVDTGASHNYVAGDFLEFLRKNGTHITECKCGLEVIQTASGEITTASKLVTLPLIIAGQWTRAKFVWHDDEPAPRLKLLINGHVVQVSCDMSTKDSAMKPPRRRSPAEDRAIHDFINESLENGTIRHSSSAWSSPVHIVPKPDGKKRVMIDYHALNRVTCRDTYPIPRADDSLNLLAGSRYFTSLDFLNGFWQIPMKESHKGMTAFSCRYGHFEWNVMPMGLTNVPAMFQRAMNDVLADFINQCCIVYLDDITVFSPDLETHKKDVDKVCATLEAAGFVLSLHKCHFAKEEIKMLGHIINSGKTIMPKPAKVEAITTWPFPADITSIRGFLNVCGYYRRFIEGFAGIADPLYELTEGSPWKGAAIDMTEPRKCVFNELKAAVQNMVLGLPQLDRHYYIESDASDTAIGAVLSQVRHDWQGQQFNDWELPPKSALQPVAFFSKHLSKTERNYSARERELLGGIASMTHFCCYIDGAPGSFTWVTDHKGIVYFCTQCELTPREYCYLDHIEQPTALERLTTDASDGELAIKPGMAEAVAESIACKGHSTWLSIEQKVLSIAETAVRNSVSTEEALPSVDTARLDDGNVAKALQKVEHWVLQLFVEDSHLFCLNKLGSRNENTADALHMMENLIYRIIYISPYHPQTNGKVERFNGILLNALNHHPRFQFQATDNASDVPNASRNHELEARARQIMERRALLRERSHLDRPEIAVGDIVLARNCLERAGKYDPPWSGPYLVSSISVEGVAELVSCQGQTLKSTINVSDLKLAHGPSADWSHWFPRPPPQQSSFIDNDNASSKQLDLPAESPAHSWSNDDDSGSKGKGKQGFTRSKSYRQFKSSDSGLIPVQEDDWDTSLAAAMQVSHLQKELFDREGDGNNGDPGPSTHATAEPLDPTCYGCGEPGHALRDCPALSTSASHTAAWKALVLEPSSTACSASRHKPADQKRGDRRGDGTYVGPKQLGKACSEVMKELRWQATKVHHQSQWQSAAYKAYNKMWKRSHATCTYQRQYQEELKRLNFLTGGAIWQDCNQWFKACFTPEAY
ncbi:hypothetical protein NDA14_002233 [Ustilago hordei]|nr:hypothetical protein NDA14_002233 [Ustilago hordei]